MRTASGYHAPAVPYHTLIRGSLSTPNTALIRKNTEYITNTVVLAAPHGHVSVLRQRASATTT
jgi:hypothetical protein